MDRIWLNHPLASYGQINRYGFGTYVGDDHLILTYYLHVSPCLLAWSRPLSKKPVLQNQLRFFACAGIHTVKEVVRAEIVSMPGFDVVIQGLGKEGHRQHILRAIDRAGFEVMSPS